MKRRLISFLMCAVLAFGVGMTAACNNAEEDLNSFTVWMPFEVDSKSGATSYADLSVYQQLKEISGMDVTYVHGTYEDIQQLWTGDYEEYDVILLNDAQVNGSYPGGMETGVSDDVLWDLTDYVEEYMPNYLASLDASYENMQKYAVTDTGKYIGIYNVPVSDQGPWYGYVVRQDWLYLYQVAEEIIPSDSTVDDVQPLETYQEWEDFLVYAKNNLTRNNAAPLFLYYTGVDMVGHLNAGFDVSAGLYLKDGTTVAYGAVQEEFKDYLDLMHRWYEMGLIDTNFATNNSGTESYMPTTAAMDNFSPETMTYTPAQYAAFPISYTYISTYESLMSALSSVYTGMNRPAYTLMPASQPVQTEGQEAHIRLANQAPVYAVVTNKVKSEEKLAKILEWFDYLYSDEGAMLMNYGIEGDTYTLDDNDEPQFTAKITANKEGVTVDEDGNEQGTGLSFSEAINKYCALNFVFSYDWTRELQVVSDKARSAMEEVWFNDAAYVLPTLSLTEAEGRVSDAYELNASTYRDEFIVSYITTGSGANNQTFEQFVNTMNTTYHVSDLVEVYAAAYARFLAR